MYVAGDAAATAANLVANVGLVRVGVVADLVDQTIFVFLALTLYLLLQHVHQSAARAMVVLVALAAGITCLNTALEFEGLRVATGAVNLAALGTAGSNALVLLLLDTQHYGILVAQIFFGLWLMPLGYLADKSGLFPKALGVVLIVGGVCYLVDLLAAFLVPDVGQAIHAFVVIPSALAEISMVLYLLVIGVRPQEYGERVAGQLRSSAKPVEGSIRPASRHRRGLPIMAAAVACFGQGDAQSKVREEPVVLKKSQTGERVPGTHPGSKGRGLAG
jgi:hypothetical protein